ncbi:hypothetical protein E2C01_024504 [Portunus trituberculatus]|uniref:Uncharacterized protein n=1 Tax=Portunus trituberculatus TaxID=210409 RepID=A0A5B7EAG9_PORTR|nr:hypothetical protein [Portunus trituberculatus]
MTEKRLFRELRWDKVWRSGVPEPCGVTESNRAVVKQNPDERGNVCRNLAAVKERSVVLRIVKVRYSRAHKWVEVARRVAGRAVQGTMDAELGKDLPQPWSYAVTQDGRIFFIK